MTKTNSNKTKFIDLNQEEILNALKILENNSNATQRELAKNLNLSLGKINYVMQALVNHGLLKVERFINSNKKSAYFYYLTPKGLETKTILAKNFLKRKIQEYLRLKEDIEELKRELEQS